ncbi:MAG: type II secretion system F family protein [Calditrichaeota bacterium]|nr:MAG: type II secretion system F family protein [Calditrichota bacterium]
MPLFSYKAINTNGIVVEDTVEAASSIAASDKLRSIGYHPLNIKSKNAGLNLEIFNQKAKIKTDDVIVFTRQLVVLLKAGVPLLSCLDALAEQAENESMRDIIMKIYVDIESGISFSEALSKHPQAFEKMYINTIRAGEMGGALDKVLARLAELMEFDRETRAQIKSAMRHPVIIVVSLTVAFISLMLFVVPKFIDMFAKLGVNLPLPTRLLIAMYTIISGYWYIVGGVLIASIIGFKLWVKTPSGAYNWDLIKLKMPIFGALIMKSTMSRFTRMLETLNSSGLPILQALDIVSKTVGNEVIGKEIEKAALGVRKGDGLAVPLRQSKLFPPMVIRMISIGEQSGSLDEMLLNISGHYDVEVDYAVKSLSSMIEPIITVMLGIIVLFLALAIFLPMWDLTSIAN